MDIKPAGFIQLSVTNGHRPTERSLNSTCLNARNLLSFSMILQRVPAHPALQAFMKEYMLFHLVYDPTRPNLVKSLPPLPEHGLEFLPKGLATSVNQQTGAISQETPYVIFGQPVSRINFILPAEDYLVIRVIFQPGGSYR